MRSSLIPFTLAAAWLLTPAVEAQRVDVYSRPQRAERSRDYDALHYRIELGFEERSKSFWGKTTITLASLRTALKQVDLDAETFTVDAVADVNGKPLGFAHDQGRLSVTLAEPLAYEARTSFTVSYHAENVDVDPERFGMAKGYDLGLDFKSRTADHPQLINTLSFPEGARHWFPAYDHPNDRATNELLVQIREDYKVLSNGRLLEVKDGPGPGIKTWHWSQELPHPTYLFVLVAGPYVVLEDALGDLPIHYWVYEKDVDDAMRSFRKTPEILDFFNDAFGYDYPWAKYDQITIPGIGGGAESTSATVLGESTIHDARADQDFPSHWLVAHEAAHQWWGNLVSYRDWGHTWLSESFATYGEYLFSAYDQGPDEGAVNLLTKKNAYLREARERYVRPIVFHQWEYPNQNFDAHTYPKGAAVLNLLRRVLGEDDFQRALSHFLQEHAFQPVDTHDLMVAIKDATGQNVDWFFEQWVFGPGHPVFRVDCEWDEDTGKLKLRVRQTQDLSRGVAVFRAPVDIGVHTASGIRSHTIWLEAKDERFELDAPERPLLVRFDEGNFLLKEWTFQKSTDELLYQLQHDDVIGRMWAAGELSASSSARRTIVALEHAASDDPFWSVRVSAVEALAEIAGESAIPSFRRAALDASSRVRVAALRALGDTGNPELAGFLAGRFESDDSYLAQAEAIASLGRLGDAGSIPLIERAKTMVSPRDVIRVQAEAALAAIRAK